VSRSVGKSSLASFRFVVKCNGEPACEAYEVITEEPTQVLDPSGRTIPFRLAPVAVDSARMSIAHQNVAHAVHKARDEAKAILNKLEAEGHPQTGQSSALYLALVMQQKRLLAVDPPPPPLAQVIPELAQLASECSGPLAPIKPLLDEAIRVARAG